MIEYTNCKGKHLITFVTDLKLLASGLDMTETNKLIRNAIACKSQRCLEKTKNLPHETAISISRNVRGHKGWTVGDVR